MELFQKMEWIHCNSCYAQPGDSEGKEFRITNCGHIFCTECANPSESKICRLCQVPCCSVILGSNMNKDMEMYFTDPYKCVQKIINVLEFQKKHRTRLNKFKDKQLNALKKEVLSLKEKVEHAERKMFSMHEEFKRMGSQLMEYKQELECLKRSNFSRDSPAVKASHSNNISSMKLTPNTITGSLESKGNVLKRPPGSAKFFSSSAPNASLRDNNSLITPLPKVLGSCRSSNVFDSNFPNSDKWSPQRDPFFRKFKLPGDRGGPPGAATALHRLNMSAQRLKLKRNKTESSRFSEYFK